MAGSSLARPQHVKLLKWVEGEDDEIASRIGDVQAMVPKLNIERSASALFSILVLVTFGRFLGL